MKIAGLSPSGTQRTINECKPYGGRRTPLGLDRGDATIEQAKAIFPHDAPLAESVVLTVVDDTLVEPAPLEVSISIPGTSWTSATVASDGLPTLFVPIELTPASLSGSAATIAGGESELTVTVNDPGYPGGSKVFQTGIILTVEPES